MNDSSSLIETLERRVFLSGSAAPFWGAVTVPGTLNDYADSFASVKVTPDGKIVAVGRIQVQPYTLGQWAVFEFNADGSLNTNFGANGQAANPFAGADSASAAATIKIVNDPNDSGYTILIGGSNTLINPKSPKKDNENFALARYTSGGQLDTTFNSTGVVTRDLGSLSDNLDSLMVNADQSILVAGTIKVGARTEPVVIKLNADGTPFENSASPFGQSGVEIYSFDRGASSDVLTAVPQGAGPVNSFYLIALGTNLAVARCQESGVLDPTFGSTLRAGNRNGFTKLPHVPGGTNAVFGIDSSDPTGLELALAGTSPVGVSKIAFEKLTNIGTADTTFGRKNGLVIERLNYPDKAAPHGAIFISSSTIFTFGYTYALTLNVKTTDLVYQQYTIATGAVSVDPTFNSSVPVVQSVVGTTRFNAVTREPGIGPGGQDAFVFGGDLNILKTKTSASRHILALYRIYADGQQDPTFVG
jgi:uncharacterized delta-60 repeat protein